MCEQILYHEYIQGGDDTDGNNPNGIVVTLAKWEAKNWKAQSHYTITSRVMVNHELVVDEMTVSNTYSFQADSKMIRKAIARLDQLIELNPDCAKPAET